MSLKSHQLLPVALCLLLASVVQAQLSKTGACPQYQTDRSFNISRVSKISRDTFYLTHALPNADEDDQSCVRLRFDEDHTFKYSYLSSSGTTYYFNGAWSAFPTTLHTPGKMVLEFDNQSFLGAGSTTTATLFVLYEHEGGMLVVAACQAGFLGYYHDEYLYVFARKDIAKNEEFYQAKKDLLITMGTPNSAQLRKIEQIEHC